MPIYEYKCDSCENLFSKLVFSSTTEIACPSCNADNVTKQMSSFACSSSDGGGGFAPSGGMGGGMGGG